MIKKTSYRQMIVKIVLPVLMVLPLFFGQSSEVSAQACYTNVAGCGTNGGACLSNPGSCNLGWHCDLGSRSCSYGINSVVKWVCEGRMDECRDGEAGWSTYQQVTESCGKTVQIDVFKHNCRNGGPYTWSCGSGDLLDYIVYYTGDCPQQCTTCSTAGQTMTVTPSNPLPGQNVTFTFTSVNQGSTWITDALGGIDTSTCDSGWLNDHIVLGYNPVLNRVEGSTTCQAPSSPGTYTWTHGWKNDSSACPTCNNSTSYTVQGGSTPYRFNGVVIDENHNRWTPTLAGLSCPNGLTGPIEVSCTGSGAQIDYWTCWGGSGGHFDATAKVGAVSCVLNPNSLPAGYQGCRWEIINHPTGAVVGSGVGCTANFTQVAGDWQRGVTFHMLPNTVSCSLEALNPSGGEAPLQNVDMRTTIGGSATGTIAYSLDCGNGAPVVNGTAANGPIYLADVCNYATPSSYQATMTVTRQGDTRTCSTTVPVTAPVLYSISGSVFVRNNYTDPTCTNVAGDALWSGSNTMRVSLTSGVGSGGNVNNGGAYTIANVPNGTHVARFDTDNVPSGYELVNLSCGERSVLVNNNNEVGVNYVIRVQKVSSWWQVFGGDVLANAGGIRGILRADMLPGVADFLSKRLMSSLTNSAGVVMRQSGTVDVGSYGGQVRQDKNWSVVSGYDKSRRWEKYDYFANLFEVPHTATSLCNNQSQCSNAPKPSSGVYYWEGEVVIDTVNWDLGAGEKIVVFVDKGNLQIKRNIMVPNGAFLAFIHADSGDMGRDIVVANNVTVLEGIYLTNNDIVIESNGTDNDLQFQGRGSFIAWDIDSGVGPNAYRGIALLRSRQILNNNDVPAETFTYRPDLILNAPDAFKRVEQIRVESAPTSQ
jgi:hypothetical protein